LLKFVAFLPEKIAILTFTTVNFVTLTGLTFKAVAFVVFTALTFSVQTL